MNIVGEMRYNLGNDYAQLKFSETKETFSVDIVMVPAAYRGKGMGTFLINHVLLMADRMEKDVLVSARPIGQLSQEKLEQLVRFYEKFGFRVYDRGLTTAYMRRTRRPPGEEDPVRDSGGGGGVAETLRGGHVLVLPKEFSEESARVIAKATGGAYLAGSPFSPETFGEG